MSKPKYNWKELRAEWLTGKYISLKVFAEQHNIKYSALMHQAGKWRERSKKIEELTITKTADRLATMQAKHIKVGEDMIDLGMTALISATINSSSAIDAIRVGADLQKDILMPKGEEQKQPITIVFQALQTGELKRPTIVEVTQEAEILEESPTVIIPHNLSRPTNELK